MSMEIQKANLTALAQTLLEQDEDKVITQDELKNFVASNDEALTEMNINANDAMNEMQNILKDNMEQVAQNTENKDAEGTQNNDSVAEYNKLKEEVAKYQDQLAKYDIQINTATKEAKGLEQELQDAIKQYDAKEAQLTAENKELENITKEINSTQTNLESDVAHQQKRAIWNAIHDYNPDKDGDWDSYIQKACEGSVYSPYASKLSSLVSESKISMNTLQSIASSLSSMGQNVQSLSDKVTEKASEISNLNALKATTQTALEKAQNDLNNSILNFVTCEEMALVTNNNINLKETMSDGNPRYIFAKGQRDGEFHIYDMQNDGASLARQYGNDVSDLRGSDIVPSGNGYLRMIQDDIEGQLFGTSAEDGCQEQEIFWLTDCGMDSKCASYYTCSPLEFDIQGDGHNLDTSKTTKFDIDGDGKLDNINDSLDGVLVFDKDGDGISGEDGSEMFGNNTDLDNENGADGYNNGFEALKALRDKAIKEGVLTDRGDNKLNAEDLDKLEKNYGLKMKTSGYNSQAQSLSDVGITEINLSDSKVSDKQQFDSFGNEVQTQDGATFKINGEENSYVDMWHRKYSDDDIKNYDSILNSSNLEFDFKKANQFATSTKADIQSRMSNSMVQTMSNKLSAQATGSMAINDMQNKLHEVFWKNTSEPENFFMKNEDKAKEEAKKIEEQEQAKKEQEIEEQQKIEEEQENKELEEKKKLEKEEDK